MIDPKDISDKLADVDWLLAKRLGLRRGPLAARARRAGRLLPNAIRRDITWLGEAGQLSGHPVLSARIDAARLDATHARVVKHLSAIDVADRRKGAFLAFLAVLSVNLFVLILLVLWLLNARGLI